MIDFDSMNHDLLLARGKYATARSLHEDAKKQAQILCGGLSATAAQILRAVQPDGDAPHDQEAVDHLLAACHKALASIEACAGNIRELAATRAALKGEAWPK